MTFGYCWHQSHQKRLPGKQHLIQSGCTKYHLFSSNWSQLWRILRLHQRSWRQPWWRFSPKKYHLTEHFSCPNPSFYFFHWISLLCLLPPCPPVQRTTQQRLNYSKMKDEQFFDQLDQYIRIGAAQIRTLKINRADFIRAAKKCSQEEKKAIEEILELVSVDPCSLLKFINFFFMIAMSLHFLV